MIFREKIKKILLITLTNIGDVVLTTPVISALRREFPWASLSIMVGPRAKELFNNAPGLEVIAYDKLSSTREKSRLIFYLRSQRYDLVVDLRNTIFPLLIGAKYRTSLLTKIPAGVVHMKEQHLNKLRPLGVKIDQMPFFIWINNDQYSRADELIGQSHFPTDEVLVGISPGARSDIKRWPKESFARLADRLIEENGVRVLMLGDKNDQPIVGEISSLMKQSALDLSGQTSLQELAAVLKRCALHITNDSAPMHISAALDVPTLAIFGPTDHCKYAPLGKRHFVLYSREDCSPCEVAECRRNHECMRNISPQEAFQAARTMLTKALPV